MNHQSESSSELSSVDKEDELQIDSEEETSLELELLLF